jgi:hypothetical protein
MGLYSVVMVTRLAPCPRCGHDGDIRVQIHYGNVHSHRGADAYRIGDLITWGDYSEGVPAAGTTEILGYPEWCPVCGLEIDGDYVLTIQDGRITGYRPAQAADVQRLERT